MSSAEVNQSLDEETSSARQKSLRVCFPFIGDDVGGSHVSALKLLQNLDPDVAQPVVALHQTTGLLADFLRDQGQDFIAAPDFALPDPMNRGGVWSRFTSGLGYIFQKLPRLRRFLREQDIDILHTNDGRIHAVWAPATFAHRTRLLWHHRGDPTARGVNLLAPIFADHLVTVSRFSRPNKPVQNIEKKWSVVHSPFDHPDEQSVKDDTRAKMIEELGCEKNARFLGYFGGLIDRKRPLMMADIVHRYKERYPDVPVHAVLFGRISPGGEQLDDATRERAEELGVGDRVHLMGFRSPIEPLIRAVDLMLIPAINEPFGRTLIEAMLLGVPVIATRHGGNPEAIEDGVNGCLVEAENPDAFVAPIHRLLGDEVEYRRIVETARTMALSDYGNDKHVRLITDVYRTLART